MIGVRAMVLCAVLFFAFSTSLSQEHPLLAGIRLAETQFSGWKYGHRIHRRQLNCVQFVVAVVRDLVRRELTPSEQSAILINNIARRKSLNHLIPRDDKRIRGIQTALLEMGKGRIVSPEEAQPGDFVQYWRLHKSGWRGHAGIIVDVKQENGILCASVLGSHQSLNRVGIGNFLVGLNDPGLKIYLVRFAQKEAS